MSRCPVFTFQVLIMSEWLSKHISTNFSFKITIRKKHVYIDIRWLWKWNQYFYFGIWEERSKIIFFPSFQLVTRLMTSTTLITLVHNSLGETEWCEKSAFQLLEMRKMKVSWNIKTKYVTGFLLTVRSSSMKYYTCHYVVST